ncbi:DsbA family protein [Conexibacter sp. SYSU D00693]|uniref:DsbA family protein n=1 Tax=Conexibacter sp. SYSU D00693 TaxID=2812560 RepID=UPI00196B27C0|nr:DsbA family protein [Conexibacter sp. SYSU D00693]
MARTTFYLDLLSPYAWLAAERIDELLPEPPVWTPVLLGAIFQATGRSSWALTDAREQGIAEVERRAAERGLPPLRWADDWPANGLLAARCATAADARGALRPFALAAMRLHFTEARQLDAEGLAEAARRAGLDPDELLEAAGRQTTKDALRAATDAALAAGVTGIPSVVVDGEVVWGDDRLEEVAARA